LASSRELGKLGPRTRDFVLYLEPASSVIECQTRERVTENEAAWSENSPGLPVSRRWVRHFHPAVVTGKAISNC
jgi:hypothetical protein